MSVGAATTGPSKCHGTEGTARYKLPLLLPSDDPATDLKQDIATFFLGIRMILKGKKEAELAFMASGQVLRQVILKPGKMETRFVAISGRPNDGVLLEIIARGPSIADLEIVEYGVFLNIPDGALPKARLKSIFDCTESPMRKDTVKGDGIVTGWGIGSVAIVPQGDAQFAFLAGWSRFERVGIWTIARQSFFSFDITSNNNLPFVVGFNVRPYRARHVEVRINGGASHRWRFNSSDFQRHYLPISIEESKGNITIEFTVFDPASPAEIEGSTDSRSLGILVSSVALLDLTTVAGLVAPKGLPELADKTIYCFTAGGIEPEKHADHWKTSNATIVQREASVLSLLCGWSKPETTGVWTDGRAAFLILKRPIKGAVGRVGTLSFEMKPVAAMQAKVRVDAGRWTTWNFTCDGFTQQTVTVNADEGSAPFLMVEIRPEGAISPSQMGTGTDERLLGIFMGSVAYMEVELAVPALATSPTLATTLDGIRNVSNPVSEPAATVNIVGSEKSAINGVDQMAKYPSIEEAVDNVSSNAKLGVDMEGDGESEEVLFDISQAKTLRSGNIIVDIIPESLTHRKIFLLKEPALEGSPTKFRFKAAIEAGLDSKDFVEQVYLAVLSRRPDATGKNHYSKMIDNGKQNEFGVISILAGSKEAQNRSERLLIVPVASDARPAFSVDFVPGKQEEGELVLS